MLEGPSYTDSVSVQLQCLAVAGGAEWAVPGTSVSNDGFSIEECDSCRRM